MFQGDQMGQIFTHWVIVYFEQLFEKLQHLFGVLHMYIFTIVKVTHNFDKMGLATFWPIFSQTHPVTLASTERRNGFSE
jgi:hypothetical protein